MHKKGIVDPWRITDPLYPEKREPPTTKKKINVSEIDYDADLLPVGVFVLPSRHGSIEVRRQGLQSAEAGLRALAGCLRALFQCQEKELTEAGIGILSGGEQLGALREDVAAASISTTDEGSPAAIWFVERTWDAGMLDLLRCLNHVRNRPGAASTLKQWGVTPIIVS